MHSSVVMQLCLSKLDNIINELKPCSVNTAGLKTTEFFALIGQKC